MTRSEFWDYPPTRRHLEISVRHYRRRPPQYWVLWAAMFALVLIVWRFSFVLLLAAVMLGQTFGEMLALAVVIVAVIAWREHRAGRPF
jgi:hypothetical protein